MIADYDYDNGMLVSVQCRAVSYTHLAYLAFYDKNGTMVKLSEAAFVGGNSKGSGCILSFDIDFVYEDYKDCELSLMIILSLIHI